MRTIVEIGKGTVFFAAVAFAGLVPTAAFSQAAATVMKISTATINDSQHEWMKVFAAAIDKASNRRIKAELYPASQLGSIPRQIEGTQFGSIQAWIGPPEFLTGVDSRYEVLSVPGVFKDALHVSRTYQDPEFSAAFLALGANRNLKGLSMWLYGPTVIVVRTPVEKLADLEGKKIRVFASPMQLETMRRLKATGVPMSLGEVIPALQQGTIDANIAGYQGLTLMRMYTAAKYVYESNHSMITSVAVVNKSWFESLLPDLQKAVADTAQQTSVKINEWAIELATSQRAAWLKVGGKITEPTAAERAQMMKLMAPIGAEIASKKPAEKAMFELLLRAAKRTE